MGFIQAYWRRTPASAGYPASGRTTKERIMQLMPVVGCAPLHFQYRQRWARLPRGMRFGTTHAIAEDRSGCIYVHHTGAQCVTILQPDGMFIDSWGLDIAPGAHGMQISQEGPEEFLYLSATTEHVVVKTTLGGDEILRLRMPDRPDIYSGDERLFIPTECAVARNGTIYVTDGYGQPWVHLYDRNGVYLHSFGGPGSGPGQFNNPHGIKIDTRQGQERVLVADRGNKRLQYFSLDGTHLGTVEGMFRFPCTTHQVGEFLYVPDLFSRVTVLDGSDQLIAHLGDWPDCRELAGWPNLPESHWVPGKFASPHDLHVDHMGNLYVAEWLSNGCGKVVKLERLN